MIRCGDHFCFGMAACFIEICCLVGTVSDSAAILSTCCFGYGLPFAHYVLTLCNGLLVAMTAVTHTYVCDLSVCKACCLLGNHAQHVVTECFALCLAAYATGLGCCTCCISPLMSCCGNCFCFVCITSCTESDLFACFFAGCRLGDLPFVEVMCAVYNYCNCGFIVCLVGDNYCVSLAGFGTVESYFLIIDIVRILRYDLVTLLNYYAFDVYVSCTELNSILCAICINEVFIVCITETVFGNRHSRICEINDNCIKCICGCVTCLIGYGNLYDIDVLFICFDNGLVFGIIFTACNHIAVLVDDHISDCINLGTAFVLCGNGDLNLTVVIIIVCTVIKVVVLTFKRFIICSLDGRCIGITEHFYCDLGFVACKVNCLYGVGVFAVVGKYNLTVYNLNKLAVYVYCAETVVVANVYGNILIVVCSFCYLYGRSDLIYYYSSCYNYIRLISLVICCVGFNGILTCFGKYGLVFGIVDTLFYNVAVFILNYVICSVLINTRTVYVIGCCDGDHNIILAVCDIGCFIDIEHRLGSDGNCRLCSVRKYLNLCLIACLVGSNDLVGMC